MCECAYRPTEPTSIYKCVDIYVYTLNDVGIVLKAKIKVKKYI